LYGLRKLVDGRIAVKRLQRKPVGLYITREDHYSAWTDSGALYAYPGIRQVDSSLAGDEKWMLEIDSTPSLGSYVNSDEFQIN
jgi:hypothetical protein